VSKCARGTLDKREARNMRSSKSYKSIAAYRIPFLAAQCVLRKSAPKDIRMHALCNDIFIYARKVIVARLGRRTVWNESRPLSKPLLPQHYINNSQNREAIKQTPIFHMGSAHSSDCILASGGCFRMNDRLENEESREMCSHWKVLFCA